jgi:methyl coenzyme M reductase subunit C-like uncharacterized protein (methanogenesis marker protein 7)
LKGVDRLKNEDIHKGLDKAEIRDFLAKRLLKSAIECYYASPEHIQSQIDELQVQLNHAKTHEAIQQIMEDNGWTDHDVTEDIEDYNNETYMPFIGTVAECEEQVHFKTEGLSALFGDD